MDFSAETLQAKREWHNIFKLMKGKNLQPRMLYTARLLVRFSQWRNQKLHRQANTKRIQHHHTSFATNAKGSSLGGKEKDTTRKKKIMNGKTHR